MCFLALPLMTSYIGHQPGSHFELLNSCTSQRNLACAGASMPRLPNPKLNLRSVQPVPHDLQRPLTPAVPCPQPSSSKQEPYAFADGNPYLWHAVRPLHGSSELQRFGSLQMRAATAPERRGSDRDSASLLQTLPHAHSISAREPGYGSHFGLLGSELHVARMDSNCVSEGADSGLQSPERLASPQARPAVSDRIDTILGQLASTDLTAQEAGAAEALRRNVRQACCGMHISACQWQCHCRFACHAFWQPFRTQTVRQLRAVWPCMLEAESWHQMLYTISLTCR